MSPHQPKPYRSPLAGERTARVHKQDSDFQLPSHTLQIRIWSRDRWRHRNRHLILASVPCDDDTAALGLGEYEKWLRKSEYKTYSNLRRASRSISCHTLLTIAATFSRLRTLRFMKSFKSSICGFLIEEHKETNYGTPLTNPG